MTPAVLWLILRVAVGVPLVIAWLAYVLHGIGQIGQPPRRGGYSAGDRTVDQLPPPPPSVSTRRP